MAREIKIFIAVFAVGGLLIWGVPGLILGLVIGFAASLFVGVAIQKAQGGAIPRKAREDLLRSVRAEHADVVKAAFPKLEGRALDSALEEIIEQVERTAKIAPSHSAMLTRPVVGHAATSLATETDDSARKHLILKMWDQMQRDWYPPPKARSLGGQVAILSNPSVPRYRSGEGDPRPLGPNFNHVSPGSS